MFFLKICFENLKGIPATFGSRPAEAVQSSSHTPPGPLHGSSRSPPNPFGVRASLVSDGNVQVNPCSGPGPRVHHAGDTAPGILRRNVVSRPRVPSLRRVPAHPSGFFTRLSPFAGAETATTRLAVQGR